MRLIKPMDAESAIRVLEMAVTYNGCGRATSDDLVEALKMAKEAIKKSIPKKPEIIACDEKKRYHCSCGKTLFIKYTGGGCHGNKAKHCDKCGQAIDWGEGGEE